MAGKIRHLVHHHGRYYARVVVPKSLRPILGKSEFWEPLDAERRIALQLLSGAVARMQYQIEAARIQTGTGNRRRMQPVVGRPMTGKQIANAHYESELAIDDQGRDTGNQHPAIYADAYRDKLRLVAAGLETDPDAIGAAIGWALDGFQQRGNVKFERGSLAWRSLARTLASVQMEALDRFKERDQADFSGTPKLPVLNEKVASTTDPLAARIIGPESTLPLSDLVHKFLAERQISSSTQHEHFVSVRMFEEHLGEPKPVYKITRREILDYKNALLELPSNYIKRFPSKSLPEAIKRNRELAKPYPALQPRTVNDKWLSALRALLNWCVNNDVIPDNPANGIKANFQADKGQPSRVPFDPTDLTKIFAKPLFDKKADWGETQWAYLLSLYCGTRPSELAQVKLDSIRTERDVLVMRIQEETKNAGSQRVIPIHRRVVELGFPAYVERLRMKGATHLFPEWFRDGQRSFLRATAKAKADGKPSSLDKHYPKFLPRRFNVTYRKKIGVGDPRKDFYAFRHTFKTGLAQAGVVRDLRDSLTGHVDSSSGAVYVHGVSIEALKEAIDKLRFDGLSLT